MIKGVLLDIDGTLLLSNDAQAHAWKEAFAAFGFPAEYDAIRKLIGMDGDKIIDALFPEMNDEPGIADDIKSKRKELLITNYAPKLQPAPGAREFVQAVQQAGLKTVVASSAGKDELHALLKAAKVDDLLTVATTSDDVENAKPDPDIVAVATEKSGLPASEVVMIGDTPYDIAAATTAEVQCIALRCGGWEDKDLEGAAAVYDDPAQLLAEWLPTVKQ